MSFCISSGHGLYVRGAGRFIDEVNEARKVTDKVVDLINKNGGKALKFHDNTSRDKNTNLATICRFHNGQVRDIDVSIHFNAHKETEAPMGVEVLYLTEKALAEKVSLAISKSGGFKNRGAKLRKDLYFLNVTKKPAILIEVCFVDSKADVALYKQKFEEICKAIAESLLGKVLTSPKPVSPVPTPVSKGNTYTIKKGDTFWGISQATGIPVDNLKAYNPSVNPSALQIGSTLNLVASSKVITYSVKAGDSLWAISRTYKVTVEDIKRVNKLTSDTIQPGQKLTIPSK